MKLGFVADKLNISQGGSNFSLDLIARSMADRGHEVTVMTVNFAHENDLPEDPVYDVLEVPLQGGSRATDARGVYQRLTEYDDRFDLYHIFNPALHPIAGAYRRRHATPVVGRLNTYDIFCTNLAMMDGECQKQCTVSQKFAHDAGDRTHRLANLPKYTFDTYALPRLLNQMDRLFALSPQVKQIYEDIGVGSDQFALIPNFYDPSFGVDSTSRLSFAGDQSVLYVGALKQHKGVDLLVESASNLPAGVSIEIVGDGPERTPLAKQATELGVEDVVTFHGWVDHVDLPKYYRAADIFVHPGLWPEPFNRTILEAMQYSCPLVVSDVGAPPWAIGDCGETFERGNATALSAALTKLLTDTDRFAACRAQCPERLAEFSPERSVSLLEAEYMAVI